MGQRLVVEFVHVPKDDHVKHKQTMLTWALVSRFFCLLWKEKSLYNSNGHMLYVIVSLCVYKNNAFNCINVHTYLKKYIFPYDI